MKWHPAKRSNLFILAALVVITVISVQLLRTSRAELKQDSKITLQFGFYDLMLQQKELYDARMDTTGNQIMTNITSPDDNQFVLKGNYTQTHRTGERVYFTYTPIYFMPSKNSRMLTGNIDLLANSEFWMHPIKLDGVPLVTMQNGMIYLYPLLDE